MFRFSRKSLVLLESCDTRLSEVAIGALKISPYDFAITETLRSIERQKVLFEQGKSKTMNSRHLANSHGLSEALDFVVLKDGKITWDHKYYRPVIQSFFTSAISLGVQIESGGLWCDFLDSPHIQLKRG